MNVDIKGKKAIVFGGTSGIGLATTKMLAQAGASVRRHLRRHGAADHQTRAIFHDKEWRADDGGVITKMMSPRRQRKFLPEPHQYPAFAAHVIGARRNGPHGWAAQHHGRCVQFNQIIEIAEP